MAPGEIYRHEAFYEDPETGRPEAKSFLVLATPSGSDVVARLLTSRPHGRPESPRCFHGNPYPGFYLGVLGGRLVSKSWLDLRFLNDFDPDDLARRVRRGKVELVAELSPALLAAALECAAGADDTTVQQERHIRDVLASLRSG